MLRMLRVLNASLVKTWTGCAKSVALSPKGWAVTTISVRAGSSRPGADSGGGAPKTQGETASMKTIFKLIRNMKRLLRELRKSDNAKPS